MLGRFRDVLRVSPPLTGPLFPIGIEHLIYMKFSVTVRHMVIKGI